LKILPAKSKILLSKDSGKNPALDLVAPKILTQAEAIAEYEHLKQRLLISTLVIAVLGISLIWLFYDLNIALNYGLGACVGTLYLRQLAKSVDRIGGNGAGFQFGSPRLALVVALVIVATRWKTLSLLPVFLGFLSYKVAILVYACQLFFQDSDLQDSEI
jgi:ATP synthase protein I